MEPPLVNGVSPCEGPPGTRVKIWGENLGLSAADIVSINICGEECVETMEWVSDHKILCESGGGVGRGRIIVTSQSGGSGTCTVYFTGLEPASPGSPRLDPEAESSVWVDEDWEVFGGSGDVVLEGLPALSDNKSHFSDPLGIIKGRVGRKVSQEILQQLGRPEGSANLLSEDFNPVLFLLENHCGTSYQQLQQGLEHLKDEVDKTQQAPGQFIENNLDSFIQCYDTLSAVNKLMLTNEKDSDGLTDKLENLFRNTTLEAGALFEGLLNRKIKADTTRNALTVLQRYRFLFNLPRSIERNIKNFEYEIVTNDYERAKSLFAGTKVKVFAKVLKEVESLVSKFRSDLRKQLLHNPTTFENQKKLIKYLLDLDYVGDPCWECVSGMHDWLVSQLLEAKARYQSDSDFLEVPSVGRTHSRTQSTSSGGSVYSKATNRVPDVTLDASSKPKRIQFIERLIDIIATSLPSFFRLGQAYFNRSLFNTTLNENQDNIISENISTKGGVFDVMLSEVCEVYTDLVNASLFEDALSHLPPERVSKLGDWTPFDDNLLEVSGAWLPLCVRKIRNCLSLLQDLPLPPNPLSLVQQLSLNVCTLSSDTLFLRTTRDIEGLPEREDWRVQDEEGSIITSLPVLFENIVIDVLLTVKEIVIETHPGETKEQRDQLSSASVEYFQGLLEDFCGCLGALVQTCTTSGGDGESARGSITHHETVTSMSDDALNVPSPEEQLLLILSNSNYTRQFVTPRLFDCFTSHGYPNCTKVQERFIEQLGELERKVFESYIKLKVVPLVKLVGPGIHGGYFDWGTESVPKGIRSYLKEILLYFVHVHAEVSSISEHITKQVLSQLLEELTDEFLQQLQVVKSFSNPGRLVGHVELLVLQETLKLYVTPSTRDKFMEINEVIGSKLIAKMYGRNIRDISEVFQETNALQFRCFNAVESF